MKIAIYGLWHLGCVTAACLADKGFDVIGIDDDETVTDNLNQGKAPVYEPHLDDLIKKSLGSNLRFSADKKELETADIIWVNFDTPVDDNDRADVEFVKDKIRAAFPHIANDTIVLISSQVPVGTTTALQDEFTAAHGGQVTFAYSPENLRLGKAIEVFNTPERVIVGISDNSAKPKLEKLFTPYTDNIIWMRVESAEMVKHSLNAFLATSVTFINEVASICEEVGADAAEVERGLKSEPRIGPKAYVKPGGAFAGGTLARDVNFLCQLGEEHKLKLPLLQGIVPSNREHQQWILRRLHKYYPDFRDKKIAVLGLAYKPDTDTLRRSHSVELCRKLAEEGANVIAFDPHVKAIPQDLQDSVTLANDIGEVYEDADALVVSTEHKALKTMAFDDVKKGMKKTLIIDQNGFLGDNFRENEDVTYLTVGCG